MYISTENTGLGNVYSTGNHKCIQTPKLCQALRICTIRISFLCISGTLHRTREAVWQTTSMTQSGRAIEGITERTKMCSWYVLVHHEQDPLSSSFLRIRELAMLQVQLRDLLYGMEEVQGNMSKVFDQSTGRRLLPPIPWLRSLVFFITVERRSDYALDIQSPQVLSNAVMSSSNRGRGIGGRGGDKPLPVPPGQDRDRGRRGQPPVHHEAVVQTGLLGKSY